MTLDLETPVQFLRGVGPARARILEAAGYRTAGDLLLHLPSRYEDRRRILSVTEASRPGPCTLRGRLQALQAVRTRKRNLTLVRGLLEEGRAVLPVVWFNRPYLLRQIKEGEEYLLHGVLRATATGWELLNPSCERLVEAIHAARIVPIYPAIGRLGPATLRRIFQELLRAVDLAAAVQEYLPGELLRRHPLMPLPQALEWLHLPGDEADVEQLNLRRSPAHLRLIYGEFLELQLELALLRAREIHLPKPHRYEIDDRVRQVAREILPFRLTGAQKRVLREIAQDLQSPYPMLRLLQGDVGSGKTIVAALAAVLALESGLQAAFMAPTELLAEQHHGNLRRLLGRRYRIGLLTASAPDLAAAKEALARGEIQLAVGTHALIQEGVEFSRLGLAIIDEQHRFGVSQRQLLQRKGVRPDLLVMTATPIPRSLALTAYGDLELSVLDELPPGRTPVATQVAPAGERRRVYGELRRDLAAGAQAYVVFPLIEESREIDAASVAAMGERVRADLADFPSAVLHGRIGAAEREAIMRSFSAGEVRVLVATTVIEVGVDVPNASVMIIEGAERFGLAQLHQLRGRVGRGARPSRCVALYGRLSEEGKRRLKVFAATTDGFRIAEADLELRGPGDLLGTRQAGLPTFRVANLVADRGWLETARQDAREILPRLEEPEFRALRRRVEPRARSRYEQFGGG